MAHRLPNYAFVDSQNVHLNTKSQGWRVDFARLRRYLKEKYNIEKAFLFIGYLPGNQRLYTRLQNAGFIIIFRPTLTNENGTIKGNCDAELVLHTIIEYPNYDKALIVSGDGDFYCLAEYLRDNQKLEAVMVPNQRKYSALLKRLGEPVGKGKNHIIFLENAREKIECLS